MNSYTLVAAALLAASAGAAEQRFAGLIELQGNAADAEQSWLDGGLGKLRGEDGALRLAFEHELQLGAGLSTHLVAEGYAGGHGSAGFTEA